MKVSNALQLIGKCRDVLATRDIKEVTKHIYLFERVYNETRTHVDRYTKNQSYQVDFTYSDLQELSDEIFEFIKNYQSKFTFGAMAKQMIEYKSIDNKVLRQYTVEISNLMYVDCKLRECYKILSYTALIQWLFNQQDKQQELDFVITETLRSFL